MSRHLSSSGIRISTSHPNTILTPGPGADVPIGNSLSAIKRLEEKLGVNLTSECRADSPTGHKL